MFLVHFNVVFKCLNAHNHIWDKFNLSQMWLCAFKHNQSEILIFASRNWLFFNLIPTVRFFYSILCVILLLSSTG